MSIVFAAIAPHPPLLAPSIGKENVKKLSATADAFKILSRDLHVAKPDTIVVISPHGPVMEERFTVGVHETYEGALQEFGDFSTRLTFRPDHGLVEHLRRAARREGHLLHLQTEIGLDYGVTVPLLFLLSEFTSLPRVVPIYYSLRDAKTQFSFGQVLGDTCSSVQHRIAIIASADLSHRLRTDSPAGYSPRAQEFDDAVLEAVRHKNAVSLINMESGLVKEVEACGYRSILILLGSLHGMNYEPKILSYEAPFGVGYLVAHMMLA